MRRRTRGFSLIELMVVVAIVAILTAIAIPSYSAYVVRGKRAAAKTALLQDAQWMERTYTVSGCYTNVATGCTGAALGGTGGPPPITAAPQEGTASYAISLQTAAANPATNTPATYSLRADPSNGFADPTCGSFTLDNTGLKGVVVNGAAVTDATTIQTCWQR